MKNTVKNPEKADWQLLGVGVVAVALSVVGPNLAMIIGLIGCPWALVLLFRRVFDSQKRRIVMKLVAYGGCILLFVAGPGGCSLTTHRVESRMKPVIAALEQHRVATGSYPDKLDLLQGVEIPACPCIEMKPLYSLRNNGQYRLTCMTYGFNHHSYLSAEKRWIDWD